MNHWAKRALQGAVLAGGIWVIGAGIASAATTPSASTLASSILPTTLPATAASSTLPGVGADGPPAHPVTGITEATPDPLAHLVQQATAAVPGGTSTTQNLVQRVADLAAGASTLPPTGAGTGLDPAALDGTTANAPVTAPVTITGNAVGIGQPGTESDPGQAPVATTSADPDGSPSSGPVSAADESDNGAGSALLAASELAGGFPDVAEAPVTAPVLACGNTVGVLSTPTASCGEEGTPDASMGTANDGDAAVNAPLAAPALACGNAVGVFSTPSASCGDTGAGPSGAGPSGTFANAPVTAPVSVTGNAVAIGPPDNLTGIGTGTGTGAGTGGGSGTGTTATGTNGAGRTGSGSGSGADTANAPITAPVTVCGNGVGILGAPSAGCAGGNPASAPSETSVTGVRAPVDAPATICGNAVSVLGGAGGSCFAAGGGSGGGGSGGGVITAPGSGGGVITAPGSGGLPAGGPSTIGARTALVSNPVSGKPLAFTGSDLQAVLALALALLNVGTTLILAGRPRRARRGKHARLVSLG